MRRRRLFPCAVLFATLAITADARGQQFDLELPTASLGMQIVDAVSGRPIPRAEVDRWIRDADGMVHAGKAMADADGRYRLTRHGQGSATFLVKARGYRVAEAVAELREREHAEVRVALFPAVGTGGRVYGPDGAPIEGAVVMGGYPGDRTTGPILRARTDAEGEFRFPSDPEDDSSFYVIAPDHALAVTTLRASDDNVIRLEPIAEDGGVRLFTADGGRAIPARRIRVAPAGREIVPEHVFAELARMNGSTLVDIIRTDADGRSPLPRYLGRGAWDVYLRGERSADVERVGSIRSPLTETQVLTVRR